MHFLRTIVVMGILQTGASAAWAAGYWNCPLYRLSSGYHPPGFLELGDSPFKMVWSVARNAEFRMPGWKYGEGRMPAREFAALEPWIVMEMRRKAEDGFVLAAVGESTAGHFGMPFYRDFRLLSSFETLPEPSFVAQQRAKLAAKFPGTPTPIPALRSEKFPPKPPGGTPLTVKTISDFPDGVFAFVQLQGENFLRLVPEGDARHVDAGGMEKVVAAGEIELRRSTGKLEVAMSLASGTYRPNTSAMIPAVEGLWRQGIYPLSLFIHAPFGATGSLFARKSLLDLSY